jgi:hypothetical protein
LAFDLQYYRLLSVIALNLSEEDKRVHGRVNALTSLSQFEEVFWTSQPKAVIVAKFQDRVHQVHRFFHKCYKGLRMIWKTMFPLNSVPPTLLTLMSKFSNAEKVRKLVRFQLLAGAESAFAFVLYHHPSLDLETIAQAAVNVGQYFSAVKTPASIIVDRLINTTEVDDSVEIPHE